MEGLRSDQKLEIWEALNHCSWNNCRSRPEVFFRWKSHTLDETDGEEYEEYYWPGFTLWQLRPPIRGRWSRRHGNDRAQCIR